MENLLTPSLTIPQNGRMYEKCELVKMIIPHLQTQKQNISWKRATIMLGAQVIMIPDQIAQ